MRFVLGVLASVCLLSAANAARAQDKPTFVFTGIPDQDETRLAERFAKVADYLQAKLGVPVRYVPVEELSRRSDGFHEQPGPACVVRRIHRRAGPPRRARIGGHRAGRGGCRVQELYHR